MAINTHDNPLEVYCQKIYTLSPESRLVELQNLCDKFGIWQKKIRKPKTKNIILSEDGSIVKIYELLKEIIKKLRGEVDYRGWETERIKKNDLTFGEFAEKLDVYYKEMVKDTTKDGYHFMRKSTKKYRDTNNTKDQKASDITLLPYLEKIIGDYEGYKKFSVDPDEEVQIDHIMSCQVFSAIIYKCNSKYSFDRFYSWKTWLNKCWNLQPLPASVNNRKGKIEAKIIGIINKSLVDKGGKLSLECSEQDLKIISEYMEHFLVQFKFNVKSDWLNQTKKAKEFFLKFFELFDPLIRTAPLKKNYDCTGCFCNEASQSNYERSLTMHLFCEFELPGTLSGFTEELEKHYNYSVEKKNKKVKLPVREQSLQRAKKTRYEG